MENEMRKHIDKVNNFKQFNESEQKYPYDDKNKLILSIVYAKRGIEQQSDIQFNSGELVTKYIYLESEKFDI